MSGATWPHLLGTLLAGGDLRREEAAWALGEVLAGSATPAQIAAFAVALRAKGETVAELEALVDTLIAHAVPFPRPAGLARVVDVVGTGGDQSHTVNISTMAAVVAAAAGCPVVKHGNRAASSSAGSADTLEALGLPLDLPPVAVADVLAQVGITFCFAPAWHPAMRFAGPPRREIGVPTTFNLLGPLANPARPEAMAVGAADPRLAALMAGALAARGVDALVFRGDDGLDELSTTTTSQVWITHAGQVVPAVLDPSELGIPTATVADLRGGTPEQNAATTRRVLAGEPGPVLDAVLLNAAATVSAHRDLPTGTVGPADLASVLASAIEPCQDAVQSGRALTLLDAWVAAAQAARPVDAAS
jgi:anthranilate phosphoribosyltransferase